MPARVFIPSLHQCGTVTGTATHGVTSHCPVSLSVRLDDGRIVSVWANKTNCGDNVAPFPMARLRRLLESTTGPSAA